MRYAARPCPFSLSAAHAILHEAEREPHVLQKHLRHAIPRPTRHPTADAAYETFAQRVAQATSLLMRDAPYGVMAAMRGATRGVTPRAHAHIAQRAATPPSAALPPPPRSSPP